MKEYKLLKFGRETANMNVNKQPMGCDAQLAGQQYKQDDLVN